MWESTRPTNTKCRTFHFMTIFDCFILYFVNEFIWFMCKYYFCLLPKYWNRLIHYSIFQRSSWNKIGLYSTTVIFIINAIIKSKLSNSSRFAVLQAIGIYKPVVKILVPKYKRCQIEFHPRECSFEIFCDHSGAHP